MLPPRALLSFVAAIGVGYVASSTYDYIYPYCSRCSIRISEATLEIHNKKNHYVPCSFCSDTFETKDELGAHYAKIHCYRCDYCLQSVWNTEREAHLQAKHDFPCTYPNCKIRCYTQISMRSHYESAHCYRCPHCWQAILFENREMHNQKHHRFPCSFFPCELVFHTESAAKLHYEKEHCYRCQHCDQKLILKVEESRHNQNHHRIPCSYCQSVFLTEKCRADHQEREHRCQYCSSLRIARHYYPDLGKHMEKYHTFRCEHCGKILRTQSGYDSHQSENHRFPCPHCHQVETSEKFLEIHLRTKAHPNAFCCDYCAKKYSYREYLQQHVNSAHQFPCSYCRNHAFASKEKLSQHIRRCHYTVDELSDLPFSGAKGHWTSKFSERGEFKSFGVFECPRGDKKWPSAHAHSKYRQMCSECSEWCRPKMMWINDSTPNSWRDRLGANDKPHPREHCEACLNGKCLSAFLMFSVCSRAITPDDILADSNNNSR